MASTTQTRLDAFLPKNNTSPRQPSKSWRDNMPDVTDTPLAEHPLRVYVLCGVVGSGKSTLAVQWEALYPEHYVRVNQDSLGDRRKCESLTNDSLDQGKSPIIDRQNFDPSQRFHWLNIGHTHNVEVVALVFRTSKRTCADRLLLRQGHETVKTPEHGLKVLNSMTAIFTDPRAEEGFHRIVILPAGLPLRYSMADINALLAKINETPTLPGILPEQPAQSSRGGFWSHNGAGRGRGASHRRGQPYPPMSSRSSPSGVHHSGPPWTSPGRNHYASQAVSNGNWRSRDSDNKHQRPDQPNGGQPMYKITETEGQASQSATKSHRTRQTNSTSNHPAFAPKKGASTGFIDISSDEDK